MDDPRVDSLIEQMSALTLAVGALAEHVARADSPGSAPAPVDAPPLPVFTQDDGYEDLTPMNDENCARRTRLASELGILGTEPGRELVEHGARGFYRRLERPEGQERIELPRDLARRLVEDALLEDAKEAADMGADLLKFWVEDDSETFEARGGVAVEMK